MAIVPNFKPSDIAKILQKEADKVGNVILQRLKIIGEAYVADARTNLIIPQKMYQDQTGNLRSSIGYLILKDGEQIYDSFPGREAEGKSKGKSVAMEVGAEHTRGFALIVVAGMEYAGKLESKGYNVLTVQSFKASSDVEKAFKRIKDQIGKMK